MASKIIILIALLILPSISQTQNKPAFSVELKLDKTKYEFGEVIKAIIIVKNISAKKDSLLQEERYGVSGNNITLLANLDNVNCIQIWSHYVKADYKIFKAGEVYSREVELSGLCQNSQIGTSAVFGTLDTGFYTLNTYLNKIIGKVGENYIYEKIYSNQINFHANPPDEIEKKAFNELSEIVSYTSEQRQDSVYMLNILFRLNELVRRNINTYSSDRAYFILGIISTGKSAYRKDFLELSKFYLENKPNGAQIHTALWKIYDDIFKETSSKHKGIEKLNEYIILNPGTEIEKEAKKIIEYKRNQKEN
ncbi:MAG: hypothetical protein J0M18_12425 [Ignavibacteria bacterium]|nr:hypothetical protein [Ignavibacteria bacterium]